jgi:hypothetical protein
MEKKVNCFKILLFLSDLTVFRDKVLVSGIYLASVSARNNKIRKRRKIHKKKAQ